MEIHEVPIHRAAPLAKRLETSVQQHITVSWNHKSRRLAAPGVAWQATGMFYHEAGWVPSWIYSLYPWAARVSP